MRQILLSAALMIATVSLGFGQAKDKPGGASGNDEQALAQLGRDWVNAYIQKDTAKLGEILADDFTVADLEGKTMTKSEYLNEVKNQNNENRLVSWEFVEGRTHFYAETAVLTGRYTSKFMSAGKSGDDSGRYVVVGVKRQGRWRPVFGQFFPAPQ